jgi:hypothetical protein
LGDVRWGGVDLTRVNWDVVQRLGDERNAGFRDRADDHQAVVRAYRQLATVLREQGLSEEADRFLYRAQVRKRSVLVRRFRIPQYLGSWLLAALAGYGFRPGRTLFWYLLTVAGFAFAYLKATSGWIPFGLPTPPPSRR